MATKKLLGKKAPAFALKDKDGADRSLSELAGDFTVVYFYPKDNTPGCTIEAKTFSKDLSKFKKLNAAVVGISGGTEKTKAAFCKAHKLKVELLSDPDFSIAKKYGAYGPKKFMGRSYKGIFRKTFLLDQSQKVVKVYDDVSVKEHSAEILADIKKLRTER